MLNVIGCKCKNATVTRKQCNSNLCSCRKHGLQCVAACLHCNGEDCENASNPTMAELYDSDSDDVDDRETEICESFGASVEYYGDEDSELLLIC